MATETSHNNLEAQPSQPGSFEATLRKLEQEAQSSNPVTAVRATVELVKMQDDLKRIQEPAGPQMLFGQLSSLTQEALLSRFKDQESFVNRVANFDLRTTTVLDFLKLVHDSGITLLIDPMSPLAISNLLPTLQWEKGLAKFLDTSAMQRQVHSDAVQELIRRERAVDVDREQRLMDLKAKGLW